VHCRNDLFNRGSADEDGFRIPGSAPVSGVGSGVSSKQSLTKNKSTNPRRLRQHARRVRYPITNHRLLSNPRNSRLVVRNSAVTFQYQLGSNQ
jgi:hypothetical protein